MMPSDYNRFAINSLLRKYGFQIYSRPKNGDTLWEQCGTIYTELEALETLHVSEVEQAMLCEETYWKSYK